MLVLNRRKLKRTGNHVWKML